MKKKILFSLIFILGCVSGFRVLNNEQKYCIQNKETKQFVEFKVNEIGSVVEFEDGITFLTEINTQENIKKASFFTKNQIEFMFKVISTHPCFVKTFDRSYSFCSVNWFGKIIHNTWNELK